MADATDLDDDNDGIPDASEGPNGTNPVGDADGDGELNYLDATPGGGLVWVDVNNDSVNDFFDQDRDGVANHLDRDSDNDGLMDVLEAGGTDATGDGLIDGFFDIDNDGLSDNVDNIGGMVTGGTPLPLPNSDADSRANFLDVDSDNDGLTDALEGGGTDADGNGILGTQTSGAAYNITDVDADGVADAVDKAAGSVTGGTALLVPDSDSDGRRNYLDVDSDNDGLTDSRENNLNDADGDGRIDGFADADNDGLANNLDPNYSGSTPVTAVVNSDGDGFANYLDLDSDNDGIADIVEVGLADANNDGRVDFTGTFAANDSDGDGLVNAADPSTNGVGAAPTLFNSDGVADGLPDFLDRDSDNDGITDALEGNGTDANRDGIVDTFAGGSTNGWTTTRPLAPDTDGDGRPDFRDLDADNDGLVDYLEASGSLNAATFSLDANRDGRLDYVNQATSDTDGDGILNAVDNAGTGSTGTPLPVPNTDGTGLADFRDANADDDASPDWTEGFDDNEDGKSVDDLRNRATAYNALPANATNPYPPTDTDGDLVPDWLEDSDGNGVPNFLQPGNAFYKDSDGDGLVNLFDGDNGGRGFTFGGASDPDTDGVDRNGNGTPDYRETLTVTPLPIKLLAFTAQAVGESVEVRWQTTEEITNQYFVVERSANGTNFSDVGRVAADPALVAIHAYQFVDESPLAGTSYYRLRQVDTDGTETKSFVAMVQRWGNMPIRFFPNPAAATVYVEIPASAATSVRLALFAADGREVKFSSVIGSTSVALEVGTLPAGVYLLEVTTASERTMHRLVVIH